MSTQQDIYVPGSETRPPMLNKENYVPWSSRLLRYAKSDADCKVPVNETFHEQTDDELTEKELKHVEADDQAIQTILFGLPEEIYAAVDICETAQEIWLRVQQMMKGSNIRIQEKKAKLFNECERFTSTDGELIESYCHRFSKLMNDFQRNKHFPKKIIAQPSMNMGQDKQMQMVGGNDGNQFRHSESESSECWKSEWAYCCSGIANQNPNGNGNVVATWAEGNANGIMQASTSGTQTNKGHVYDSDGSANVEQDGGIVEQHPETVEETHAYFESLYNNLVIEVEKVNTVNRKLRETNADLTTVLARYKNQEKCFEISQEKYDKLERCYQKSVYQEQCLTKRINALHLIFGKQKTTLNEEIANLNNQLSKEKSTVSYL
ncbi:hypothetical protein Tco_0941518 [Tanacetum coccineum]|uniref:Gag-Pol polyprotein n=1 Tax=Tanacetum coccineum TaxID=301880 RepID=A0ABQ5DTT2_9ASTR